MIFKPPNARAFAGLAFSPSVSVDLSILKISLFTCPRYGHYYFGDFYDDAYLRAGIYPWFMCETNRTWYDPVFEYSRWYLEKVAPNWPERQRHEYDLRRADPRLRPARTWTEMQARFAAVPEADRRYFGTAEPIDAVAGRGSRAARFERIDGAERQRLAGQAEQVREFGRQRAAWEVREPAPAAGTRGPRIFRGLRTPQSGQPGEPDRVRIPSPPIFARPVERTVDDAMPSYPRGEREHSRERDR